MRYCVHTEGRDIYSFPGYCPERPPDWGIQPLISIVLPVYNQSQYLAESLDSALHTAARKHTVEVILVDDGSTEDLRPVLRRHEKDVRFRHIRQDNLGLAAALNAGFSLARGQFLTWTSADNVYRWGSLDELADFLLSNPSVALAYANIELIDENGRPSARANYRPQDQLLPGSAVRFLPRRGDTLWTFPDNFINSCFLYRRNNADAIGGYDPTLVGAEDYAYWLELAETGVLAHVPTETALYAYRLHRNSLTSSLKQEALLALTQRLQTQAATRRTKLSGAQGLSLVGSSSQAISSLEELYQFSSTLAPLASDAPLEKLWSGASKSTLQVQRIPVSDKSFPLLLSDFGELTAFRLFRGASSTAERSIVCLPGIQTHKLQLFLRARDSDFQSLPKRAFLGRGLILLPRDLDQGTEASIASLVAGNSDVLFAFVCCSPEEVAAAERLSKESGDNVFMGDLSQQETATRLQSLLYLLSSSDFLLSLVPAVHSASAVERVRREALLAAYAGKPQVIVSSLLPPPLSVAQCQAALVSDLENAAVCWQAFGPASHSALLLVEDPGKMRPRTAKRLSPLVHSIIRTPLEARTVDQWIAEQSAERTAQRVRAFLLDPLR